MKFVTVAQADQVQPETGICVKVGGKEIALFQVEGEFYAIGNECPHYGAELCDGYIREGVVSCPWHGWEFKLSDGVSPHTPHIKVESFQVRIEDGAVLIGVEEEAEPAPEPAAVAEPAQSTPPDE